MIIQKFTDGCANGEMREGALRELRRKRLVRHRCTSWNLDKAATTIQAFTRGCLCRQRVSQMVTEIIVEFQESLAALKIQAFVRGCLCRQQVSNLVAKLIQDLTQMTCESWCQQVDSCYNKKIRPDMNIRCNEIFLVERKTKKRKLTAFESSNAALSPVEVPYLSQSNIQNTGIEKVAEINTDTVQKVEISEHRYRCHQTQGSHIIPDRKRNLIKFFQASPLAYIDANHEPRRVSRIDIHFEREMIRKTLEGSSVDAEFDIATVERFGACLAKGEVHVLHFSCHGHPKYLAFEDGWGTVQLLEASVLKSWIACGGRQLQFVFVSACDSWSIGKAFVEAGVPHVVCCDKESVKLDSATAVKFTKALYQALAFGNTLQKSFSLACQELSVRQHYISQKFCLLPEGANHDVHIFSPGPLLLDETQTATEKADKFDLPSPTDFFVRDDLELYETIQSTKNNRVVEITGPIGIGKTTLVKECCRYLSCRRHVIDIEEIVWKSPDDFHRQFGYGLDTWFREIFNHWRNICSSGVSYQHHVNRIIKHYKKKRSLLVLEVKNLHVFGLKKTFDFVKTLVQSTEHLKLIIIHRCCEKKFNLPSLSATIQVNRLNIESSVKLFARYCPHVANRHYTQVNDEGDLWRLLAPTGVLHGNPSKRQCAILKIIGGNNPRNICQAASRMTAESYTMLVQLGRYKDLDFIRSRAELVILEFGLTKNISERRALGDTDTVDRLQAKCDAIGCVKDQFMDPRRLKHALEKTFRGMLQAFREKNESWDVYNDEIQELRSQISREEDTVTTWLRSAYFPHLGNLKRELADADNQLTLASIGREKGPRSGLRVPSLLCLRIDQKILRSKIRREEKNIQRTGVFATVLAVKARLALLYGELEEAKRSLLINKIDSVNMKIRLLKELKHLKSCSTSCRSWTTKVETEFLRVRLQGDWEQARILEISLEQLRKKATKDSPTGKMEISLERLRKKATKDSPAGKNPGVWTRWREQSNARQTEQSSPRKVEVPGKPSYQPAKWEAKRLSEKRRPRAAIEKDNPVINLLDQIFSKLKVDSRQKNGSGELRHNRTKQFRRHGEDGRQRHASLSDVESISEMSQLTADSTIPGSSIRSCTDLVD